jgi:predicted ATPase
LDRDGCSATIQVKVEFRLLGRLEVVDGDRDAAPRRRKQRALLGLLLLRAGELVTVDEAVDALWGARPPPAARNAVQGHVATLRKLLGRDRIATRDSGYTLRLEEDELDLHRFERLLCDAGGRPPREQAALLSEALGLFRGAPLQDLRYDDFAQVETARIEGLRLRAVELQIDAELALGRHDEVVPQLERLIAEAPLRERFRAQLMLALYCTGRQAEALEAYQHARSTLVDELGIEPGPELQRLERQILNQDPGLAAPPAMVAAARLPTPPTPLIGREREVEDLTGLLRRPEVRLVTLTGTGGTGKTRLAIQIATGLLDTFADGVVFVGLAPLQDPDLVLTTAAQALGIATTSGETLAEDLARGLRDRELLLVFDNFEHLLAAAPSVADVAASAAGVKLLVTSRAPLRLSAEHVYPVSPLPTPAGAEDVDRLRQCESVALFETRAQAVRPDFAVTSANAAAVADVCRALDGLPLAIELAASRVGSLPPAAMRRRLDHRLKLLVGGPQDAPERQRTLRATIDWSYELLEPAEQRLVVGLAVFAGGCTIEAAQSICGDDLDVVDGLASLTDKGLTRLEGSDEEPRFTMLETIREYALERLEDSGETSGRRRRHADYFLALAEEAEPNLIRPDAEWLDRLEAEQANLRAVLDWLEASGESEDFLRLAAALGPFWKRKRHLGEGRRRLESALRAADRPAAARAKALNAAAGIALICGDLTAGGHWAREALELNRRLGDAWGSAFSQLMVADATMKEGDWPRAQELCAESVREFRELGDRHAALLATETHAWALYEGGDLESARELSEESLRETQPEHDPLLKGFALGLLADIALDQGRCEDAVSPAESSYRIYRDVGDLVNLAFAVGSFARILALTGKPEAAARVLASSVASLGETGARDISSVTEKALTVIRHQLDEAAFAKAWEQGLTLTADEAVALALDSLAAAGTSVESGR